MEDPAGVPGWKNLPGNRKGSADSKLVCNRRPTAQHETRQVESDTGAERNSPLHRRTGGAGRSSRYISSGTP